MINTNAATISGVRAKRYINKAEESTTAETFIKPNRKPTN